MKIRDLKVVKNLRLKKKITNQLIYYNICIFRSDTIYIL
jgi:hypothetical protein